MMPFSVVNEYTRECVAEQRMKTDLRWVEAEPGVLGRLSKDRGLKFITSAVQSGWATGACAIVCTVDRAERMFQRAQGRNLARRGLSFRAGCERFGGSCQRYENQKHTSEAPRQRRQRGHEKSV